MIGTRMFNGWLFIFLVINLRSSSCVLDDIYNAGRELWKLYSMLDKITLDSHHSIEGGEVLDIDRVKNQEITNQVNEIHRQLEWIERNMNSKNISNFFKFSSSDIILLISLDRIELSIRSIDESYGEFQQYVKERNNDFDDPSPIFTQYLILKTQGDITSIRNLMIGESWFRQNYKSLVHALTIRAIVLKEQECNGPQIFSNILVHFFRIVTIAEIKANLMIAFATMCRYFQDAAWKMLNSFTLKAFKEHFVSLVNEFTLNMDLIESLYLRACDPVNGAWSRDKDFYELEGTFQATIFRYRWARCKYDSCNAIWSAQSEKCEPKMYDRRSGCSGTSAECAYLSAIEACVLRSGPYKFQYVNSTKLGLLGKNVKCPRDNGYLIEDGTGWNYNFAACACNCYRSDNKISLSIMESKVASNKVITGLRFINKNQILYIQPREGILGANGYINPHSERWIPFPRNPQTHSIDRDNRVFFLDDIRLPPYFALTGVKFNKVTRENVKGFAIEIFGVRFDDKSGKLNTENEFRISRQAESDHPWESLPFTAASSIHVAVPHRPDSSEIQYVTLKRSELSDDFGQSTLPFFDAVPVTPKPPSILGGIGIFHKGVAGYAGFISLRVFAAKYTEYFLNLQINHIVNGTILFNNSYHDGV